MRNDVRVVPWLVMKLFVIGALAWLPQAARADDLRAPPVPGALEVPDGNVVFLVGHAVGTQNYVCLPSGSGFAFQLFTPQATLFDDRGKQVITHFFSPNPDPFDNGAIRATWQHSKDSSAVFAKLAADPYTAPDFVAPGAVAWLLLQRAGVRAGPTGGDILTKTTFVQRVNTVGGLAPQGCESLADVGKKAFVPYLADYVFYEDSTARE